MPESASGQRHRDKQQQELEDAPGTVRGWEAFAMLAWASWGIGSVSLLGGAWVLWYYGGAWEYASAACAKDEDLEHFKIASMMLIPLILHEGAHVVSASVSGVNLCGYSLCWATTLQLLTKVCCYAAMWTLSGGIVHPNLRSLDDRPVYTVRFIDWAFAVPALSASACFIFSSEKSLLLVERVAPMLFVSFSYVVASWVSLVTPSAAAGWTMMLLSGIGYVISVAEQVILVMERHALARHGRFKVACWIVKEVVFCLYGIMMLACSVGLLSPASEQMFYTYGDVLMKAVHSSVLVVIRNWDELDRVVSTMRTEVDRGKEDMSRFMETASVPIVCLNPEGVIQSWNEQISKMTAISKEAARGKLFADLVAPRCRENFESSLLACKSKASAGTIELTLKTPMRPEDDPGTTTMTMNFIAQHGSDPGNSSIIGVGHDITELVATKTLQERHQQFMALVSHELRSPLLGISGLSREMADTTKDVVSKRQLNMIHGCSSRLLDLVGNIMDQAYMDNLDKSKGQEKRVPVNFLDIVDEVICMTQAAVDMSGKPLLNHGVTLGNTTALDKLPLVMGDPFRCTQLLYNLVTNACKFTRQGHVFVSARRVDGFIEIDVSDTGCGIAPHALSAIFDPCTQEHSKCTLRGSQGIGLGLSVANGIAKLHGGEIRVESALDVGSTFTVRLPCEDEEACPQFPLEEPEDTHSRSPGSKESTTAERRRVMIRTLESLPSMSDLSIEWKARVISLSCLPTVSEKKPLLLCVYSNADDQTVINQCLGNTYRVEVVKDGAEALDYLQSDREPPTLLLLSSDRPGDGGLEVCRQIRGTLKLPHLAVPIVVLSSRAPLEDTGMQAFEAGATDFLSKPFSARLLKKRLKIIQDIRTDCAVLAQEMMQQQRDDEDEFAAAAADIHQLEEALRLKDMAQMELEQVKQQLELEVSMRSAKQTEAEELWLELSALKAPRPAAEVVDQADSIPEEIHQPEEALGLKDSEQIELEQVKQQLELEVSMRSAKQAEVEELRSQLSALKAPRGAADVAGQAEEWRLEPSAHEAPKSAAGAADQAVGFHSCTDVDARADSVPELAPYDGLSRSESGVFSISLELGAHMVRQCSAVIRSEATDDTAHEEPQASNMRPGPSSPHADEAAPSACPSVKAKIRAIEGKIQGGDGMHQAPLGEEKRRSEPEQSALCQEAATQTQEERREPEPRPPCWEAATQTQATTQTPACSPRAALAPVAPSEQAATQTPVRSPRATPASVARAGRAVELGLASSLGREVRWLRHELELSQGAMSQLCGGASRHNSEARQQRCRADHAAREAAFLKAELQQLRQRALLVCDPLAGA